MNEMIRLLRLVLIRYATFVRACLNYGSRVLLRFDAAVEDPPSHRRLPRVLIRYVASVGILLVVWEVVATSGRIPAYVLPPVSKVVRTLYEDRDQYVQAALFTTQNMLFGGAIGIGAGLAVGGVLALCPRVRWLLEPYLTIFQSFPRESLAPLLIVWFGFGPTSKVVSAAMLSFFPVAVVTLAALTDTRKEYLELFRSWGASRWQEFLYCRLPVAVPSITSGVALAGPLALIGSVLGEFMGGNAGLGYLILTSGSAFRIDRVFAAVCCLAGIGLATGAAVGAARATVLRKYSQE